MPDRAEVNDTLGWVYHKKGLGSQAVAALKDAVDKDPQNASFQSPWVWRTLRLVTPIRPGRRCRRRSCSRQILMARLKQRPPFRNSVPDVMPAAGTAHVPVVSFRHG